MLLIISSPFFSRSLFIVRTLISSMFSWKAPSSLILRAIKIISRKHTSGNTVICVSIYKISGTHKYQE